MYISIPSRVHVTRSQHGLFHGRRWNDTRLGRLRYANAETRPTCRCSVSSPDGISAAISGPNGVNATFWFRECVFVSRLYPFFTDLCPSSSLPFFYLRWKMENDHRLSPKLIPPCISRWPVSYFLHNSWSNDGFPNGEQPNDISRNWTRYGDAKISCLHSRVVFISARARPSEWDSLLAVETSIVLNDARDTAIRCQPCRPNIWQRLRQLRCPRGFVKNDNGDQTRETITFPTGNPWQIVFRTLSLVAIDLLFY